MSAISAAALWPDRGSRVLQSIGRADTTWLWASYMTDDNVERIQGTLDAMAEVLRTTFGGDLPRHEVAPPGEPDEPESGSLVEW